MLKSVMWEIKIRKDDENNESLHGRVDSESLCDFKNGFGVIKLFGSGYI